MSEAAGKSKQSMVP